MSADAERRVNFTIYGLGALFLSLYAWNYKLVQSAALTLVKLIDQMLDFTLLHQLAASLPTSLKAEPLFSGYSLTFIGLGLVASALLLLKFFYVDFINSDSSLERLRLSSIIAFCLLVSLMLLSFAILVGDVMLQGKPIKPFPKEAIGAMQYLDALSFLPWALFCAIVFYVFTEVALLFYGGRRISSNSTKPPSNSDEESSHFMAAA